MEQIASRVDESVDLQTAIKELEGSPKGFDRPWGVLLACVPQDKWKGKCLFAGCKEASDSVIWHRAHADGVRITVCAKHQQEFGAWREASGRNPDEAPFEMNPHQEVEIR